MGHGEKPGVSASALAVEPRETIFGKMAAGDIKPGSVVYEDEHVLCFHDLNPVAPTHLLLIPKKVAIGQVHHAAQEDAAELGRLFVVAGQVATKLGLDEPGYRLVVNQGVGAQQSVNYLHVHLLSGRKFTWPPG